MINFVITLEKGNLNPLIDSFQEQNRNYFLTAAESEKKLEAILREVQKCDGRTTARTELAVSRRGEVKFFPLQEIYYIESFGNLKSISGRSGTFEFYGVLGRMEGIMQNYGFLRIHQSYLISLSQIAVYSAKSVMMRNGKRINIGRKFLRKYREEIRKRNQIRL